MKYIICHQQNSGYAFKHHELGWIFTNLQEESNKFDSPEDAHYIIEKYLESDESLTVQKSGDKFVIHFQMGGYVFYTPKNDNWHFTIFKHEAMKFNSKEEARKTIKEHFLKNERDLDIVEIGE